MGSTSRSTRNNAVRALYADWLRIASPAERRKIAKKDPTFPKSKQEFAKYHHVSPQALWKWEQDPEFRKLVHTRSMDSILSAEETEKAIQVLKAQAFSGNIQALKLLLNSVGLLNPEREAPPPEEEIDFGKWSDEELKAFLEGDDGAEGDSETGAGVEESTEGL